MQIDEILIGSNIELEVKHHGRTMSFRSDVVSIKNNSVLITSIKVDGQTIGFSDECLINFVIKVESKVFVWENIKVKLVRYDGGIYHLLELNGIGKPYNRRVAYRMYIGEDMPIYVNSPSGPVSVTVLVKDISETGVAFITKEDFDVDRTFRLKLKDHYIFLNLSGMIVRKEFLPHLNAYLYGCKFLEKDYKLNKYIAHKQGEQLRKKSGTTPSFAPLETEAKLRDRRK